MNYNNNFISSGIYNYGNTCYINSALQMLISIDECRDYILNFNTITDLNNIFKHINSSLKNLDLQ